MKRELGHFIIGGKYGGSQLWMMDPWMRLGGCAALAAVDSCIFLRKYYRIKKCTPIDVTKLTRGTYCRFAQIMKPYLSPRAGGVNRMELYMDGFLQYLDDRGVKEIKMTPYPFGVPRAQAEAVLRSQMDAGLLIPVLLLNPISCEWRDFHWHWFLLNGYEEREDGLYVRAVTYGGYEWRSFEGFWDEKDDKNGGMILYQIEA